MFDNQRQLFPLVVKFYISGKQTFLTFPVVGRLFKCIPHVEFESGLFSIFTSFAGVGLFIVKFGRKPVVPYAGFKKFSLCVSNLAGDVYC